MSVGVVFHNHLRTPILRRAYRKDVVPAFQLLPPTHWLSPLTESGMQEDKVLLVLVSGRLQLLGHTKHAVLGSVTATMGVWTKGWDSIWGVPISTTDLTNRGTTQKT